ncbi:ImmA/IrrE family metallo-endopeptidase [uncultured Tateyamaria sp.]|uniref:ImmA/IrrE family metallo-endopeptidase n=1 Tax=uncultured Tateyamaria sp. TaxID=455651 RepID=UPI00262D4A5F|nr:ImmA/IrrE family metallo-endopeptidase [uncultured Tateyamaria sp.]
MTKASRNPPIGEFSKAAINKQFLRSIAQLSTHPQGPLRAINELSKHSIIVVIFPLLPGTFLDGAVMLLKGKTPVIGLTLRHDRIDNFWFTLLHELSHLAKHFDILSSTDHVFFDELDIETDDQIEAEADSLAKNSLVPSKFAKVCKKKFARTEEIEKAGEEAGVHVSIVAGRWQKENSDYKKFSRLIERNTVRDMLQSA